MEPVGAVGDGADPAPPPVGRRRRPWWQTVGKFAIAGAAAVGALVVLAAILLTTAVSDGGDGVANGLSVTNRTGEDLTIVYLVGGTDGPEGPIIDRGATKEIGTATRNGTTLMTIPTPTENGCTVAPLVARRADGSEVSRLDAGACVFQVLVEWQIG